MFDYEMHGNDVLLTAPNGETAMLQPPHAMEFIQKMHELDDTSDTMETAEYALEYIGLCTHYWDLAVK